MSADNVIKTVYEQVLSRNAGETEFQQAVKEVLDSLGPVLEKHPEYVEAKILDRIVEPERQIMFRVPWQDDKGNIQVNRGLQQLRQGCDVLVRHHLLEHPAAHTAKVEL